MGDRRLILATARARRCRAARAKGAPTFAELGAVRTFPGRELAGLRVPAAARGGAAARRPGVAPGRARATSSPPRTAPASCTWRRRSAPTTTRPARARPGAGAPGRGRRHLHRHDLAGDRGPAGHRARDQRPDHPAAQAGRPLAPDAAAHAHLSALLALLEPADLLRPRLLVRAHLGGQGADARAQRAGGLASARGRRRPLRRVAREQRRLGALARPLLGHAAAGLGVRPRPVARGGDRQLRRARRAVGPAAARRTSIRTSRTSTATPGRARAAAPCAARPRSSTPGSTRARCRTRSGTTRSSTRRSSRPTSRPTSSARAWTRPAAGSTRCWRSRRPRSTARPTGT